MMNAVALQRAIDSSSGPVSITCAGIVNMAATVFLGSHTHLSFVDGAMLRKVNTRTSRGRYTHVLLNRGALTGTPDENITINGLHILVNGVDTPPTALSIPGLRGQLALFHVRNIVLSHLRIRDLGGHQFGIQVVDFDGLLISSVEIRGRKDAIHLGRGRRFAIRDGVFQTADDAIALNAHDYAASTPELGWIRDGLVENCTDEALAWVSPLTVEGVEAGASTHARAPFRPRQFGFFSRLLGGAWLDWRPGMAVRHSDSVVSSGAVYRVTARAARGATFTSTVRPIGTAVLGAVFSAEEDGVPWRLVQRGRTYDAGIANVTFRHLVLRSQRPGIQLQIDADAFSRSVYPGARPPTYHDIVVEDVRKVHRPHVLVVKTPHEGLRLNGVLCPAHGRGFAAAWCLQSSYRLGPCPVQDATCAPPHIRERRREILAPITTATATRAQSAPPITASFTLGAAVSLAIGVVALREVNRAVRLTVYRF